MPLLACLLTVLLWSFTFPASKAVLPYFEVEQVAFLRYLTATLFYLVLFAAGKFPLPQKKDLPMIALLSLLGVTVYQLCFVFGVGRVTAGAAAMIISANPVAASLLAHFFLKEKLPVLGWLGIFIAFLGVSVIALERGTSGESIGFVFLIIAVISIAIFFVFQKPYFKTYTPLAMTSYTSILGTLPLMYLLPEAIPAVTAAPASAIWSIVIMGVLSSGVGFLLWFYALSKLPAGIVTSFLFLQPVLVTVLAWYWLSEWPSNQTIFGGIVVLLGVAFILKDQIFKKPG